MEALISRRGPKRLKEGDKKVTLPIYVQKKVIDFIGHYEARAIGEKAIEKEFKKLIK